MIGAIVLEQAEAKPSGPQAPVLTLSASLIRLLQPQND